MRPQPGFHGGRFPIRQKFNHPTPLQIANQGAISVSLAPGPVVDTNDAKPCARGLCRVSNTAQESIFLDWKQKPCGECLSGTPTECLAKMSDKVLQTRGATCMWL